ncbi:hypothetical protein H0E87_001366, partial [Populus deltoides]
YSSGASIFTSSGVAARIFQTEIEVGQVRWPCAACQGYAFNGWDKCSYSVPLPFSAFISVKLSFDGDVNFDGKAGIQFYTRVKTVTQQWRDLVSGDSSSGLLPSS